jgi:CheY-like chemotaxis protein
MDPRLDVTVSARPTILVVDDERDSRDLTGDLLASAGYGVLYAGNGSEALTIVKQWHVDLIVMDMMMPIMDGVTAIRRLKSDALNARIPILAITGDPGSALRQQAVEAGCDTFMTKPISPPAFISLVRQWAKA